MGLKFSQDRKGCMNKGKKGALDLTKSREALFTPCAISSLESSPAVG
jgi:hypothetical protein